MIQIKNLSTFSLIFFVLIGLSLSVCHGDSKPKAASSYRNTYVQCKDPRPQFCTKEYLPVCAKKDNGIHCLTSPCPSDDKVTYSNACTACSDTKVYGYTPDGACN